MYLNFFSIYVGRPFKSKPGLYFKLSPADVDVVDALNIDGKSELAENLGNYLQLFCSH